MKRGAPLRRTRLRQRGKRSHAVLRRLRKLADPMRCERCIAHGPTTRHHIIPRSRGGTEDRENIAHLCCNCHRAVHDHTAVDWRDWLKPKRRST